MITADKKKQIDSTIAAINKKHGVGTVRRLGDTSIEPVPKFPTGLLSLDYALGGGWGVGRLVEVFGPESGGKTSVCLLAISNAQKEGKLCAFIDAENTFNPDFARSYGVDLENLYLCNPETLEASFEVVEGLANAGFGVIVLDSVSALLPKSEQEDEMCKQGMALQARGISQALRRICGQLSKTECTLFLISQLRTNLGTYGNPETTAGGRAIKFYATHRVNVRIESYIDSKGRSVKTKDDAVGHIIKAQVIKNKVGKPFRIANMTLLYGSGFDYYSDLFDTAVFAKVIEKAGAWYKYSDRTWQGEVNAIEAMKSDLGLFNEIKAKVEAYNSHVEAPSMTEKEIQESSQEIVEQETDL